MFCLVAGMGVMASNTSTAFLSVHMEKMQIVFPVPEVGQGAGEFVLGNLLVVATETEIIIVRAVVVVEFLGKIPHKQAAELGTMHIMAGRAITGLHRTMLITAARDFIA